jgi:hypothetical protein
VFEIRLIAGSQETVLVFIKTFTLHGGHTCLGKPDNADRYRHLVRTYSVVVCEEGRVFRANKLGDEVEIGALFVLAMEGLLQLEYPRWVM